MTDAPEEATHRIDISIYVNAESDERAKEIGKKLISNEDGYLSLFLDIPEVIAAVPRVSFDDE